LKFLCLSDVNEISMAEQYGPATVTPVTEVKREVGAVAVSTAPTSAATVEVKAESRVNGYGQASIVPATTAPQVNAVNLRAIPVASSTGLPVNMTLAHQQREEATASSSASAPSEPYWVSQREQQCCLVENGRRCTRPAGNASYSKRIQKIVAQRKLKLHMDNSARHIYICDYHKNVIQSLRTNKRKRKESEDDSGETDNEYPEVDLYQLQVKEPTCGRSANTKSALFLCAGKHSSAVQEAFQAVQSARLEQSSTGGRKFFLV